MHERARARARRAPVGLTAALSLAGCAALLPTGRSEAPRPWPSFEAARAGYARVEPYVTTRADLDTAGITPERSANVRLVDWTEVIRLVVPIAVDEELLPLGIRECMVAQHPCEGIAIEQQTLERRRIGPFLADFLNFRRDTETTGWRVSVLFVLVRGRVVYKTWTGQPAVYLHDVQRNPLGPLQGGEGLIDRAIR